MRKVGLGLGVSPLRTGFLLVSAPSLTNNNSDISVTFADQPAPELSNTNSDINVTFKEA